MCIAPASRRARYGFVVCGVCFCLISTRHRILQRARRWSDSIGLRFGANWFNLSKKRWVRLMPYEFSKTAVIQSLHISANAHWGSGTVSWERVMFTHRCCGCTASVQHGGLLEHTSGFYDLYVIGLDIIYSILLDLCFPWCFVVSYIREGEEVKHLIENAGV